MKLILSILLLFCLTTINSQTISYSYIDPCTGVLKQLNVPDNGITVTYFNQIKTFSKDDFTNGNFNSWATGVYNQFGENNPCGSTIGISNSIDIGQSTALNVVSILNSLSAITDMQGSTTSGSGMVDITSGLMGSSKSTNKKENKKSNKGLNTEAGNTTNSETNNNNSQPTTQSDANTQQTNSQTQNGSENVSVDGNSSNSNSSNSNTNSNSNDNGTTASNDNNQNGQGNTQSNSGDSQQGGTSNSNSSTNSSADVQGGNSGTANQSTQSGSSQTESSVENKSTDTPTTQDNGSTASDNSNTNNSETSNAPDQSTNSDATNQEKKSTNILGGTVNSIANASGKSQGNKPTVVLSSDFTGFNFKNNDVVYGGKATGGFTSMRWDGRRTHGFLVDYTSITRGPNVTAFYAFVSKKRIDLLSLTGTASFYGKGSIYGTLALGQMWSIKKNAKVLYLATASWGYVYQESFIGTAFITGGMYDWKVAKRLDIKLMGLFIYAPFVSYYNDIVLKSPYVVMPVVGTNVAITKKFKLNINMSGTYAIKEDVLNFTVMLGTRFAL